MFHIEPKKSKIFCSNVFDFLYQDENLFIMDNHTLASWCWAQAIDFKSNYTLLHIDQHYDLIDDENSVKSILKKGNVDIKLFSIDEFLSLKKIVQNGDGYRLFRFDSYINNFVLIHPHVISNGIFITHNIDTRIDKHIPNFLTYDFKTLDFKSIENELSGKIILNLDIDYFFSDENENQNEVDQLAYSQISDICSLINEVKKDIEVFTVALTPSFCGGLNSSVEILNEILVKTGYSKFVYT